MDTQQPTLNALLAPYQTAAIADAVGSSADAVRGWRRADQVPGDATTIRLLAEFLRVDVDLVLRAIEGTNALRTQRRIA